MNDSLPPLPEFDPHPDLWARIESDLQRSAEPSVTSLRRAVQDLPTHEPEATLWQAIESELTTPVVVRPLWTSSPVRWVSVAAAAVLILVGGWLFLKPSATETVRIEYAVEHTPQPGPTDASGMDRDQEQPIDQRAEEFIRRQCEQQQLACQRPEVHELRHQLAELTTQQQRLVRERHVFGDDPSLIQAQVKVENQRVEIIKELITILRS